MTEKEYALIVAGGKGTRFGNSVAKQFLELNGKPVLLHTLEAFFNYSAKINVVLVLPEEDLEIWRDLSEKHQFKKTLLLQTGGATRFQSVKKGLQLIGDGYVAIHDGVRPLISKRIIAESFRLARVYPGAVASVPLKESIRMFNDPASEKQTDSTVKTKAVDRSLFRIVQTPQTFQTDVIKKAYTFPEDPLLTDDASVVERAGFSVSLFAGAYENIKITTPEDLIIAHALLNHRRD